MKKRLLAMLLCIVMVLAVIPTAVFPIFAVEGEEVEGGGEAEAPKTYTYKDLYVEDATFMWDAFGMTAEDAVITAFENQVGEIDIAIPEGVTVTMGDGYVLYPQVASAQALNLQNKELFVTRQYGEGDTARHLPEKYTIEITVHQYWEETFTTGTNKWAIAGFGSCGGSWPTQFLVATQVPDATKGYIKSAGTPYSSMNADGTLKHNWSDKGWNSILANTLDKPYTFGWTTASTFEEGARYHATTNVPIRDGFLNEDLARTSYLEQAYYSNVGEQFRIGFGTPFAYYSLRVYPETLTAEQVAQNHFADLCGYYGVSEEVLADFFAMTEEDQAMVIDSFKGVAFTDASKEKIEDAITSLEAVKAEAALIAARRALYVPGAYYMWDAYNLKAGDPDVSAFLNTVEGAPALSMTGTAGDKYVRSTSMLKLGSIMPTYTDGGYVLNKDVTLEVVAHQHWDEEFKAGFDTANKQMLWTGNTLIKRWADAKNASGYIDARTQDPENAENNFPGFINYMHMASVNPETGGIANFNTDNGAGAGVAFLSNEVNEPFTFGYTFTFAPKHEFPNFRIGQIRDGVEVLAAFSKYNLQTTAHTFQILEGFCFGYYAIRSYDKVLKEIEMQQNHFADLMGYAQVSMETIEAFNALEAEAKEMLYKKFATTELKDITEDALIEAINGVEEEIAAARKEAVETAADALFTWGGIKAKLYGYAGMRVFASVGELTAEGMTLVDSGVMIGLAGTDLVVRYDEETNSYMTNGSEIDAELGYAEQIFEKVSDEVTFATKEFYEMEFAVRGYAVIEYLGETYICYTDLASEAFGASFSMYEIAQHESLADSVACQAVIAACTTPEA